MAGPETRVKDIFPLVPAKDSFQEGNTYNTGGNTSLYDFSIGDYSMQFDFPGWEDPPEPLPEEDPPEPDESALEGLLRFVDSPTGTKLQRFVGSLEDESGWVDVAFDSSDPGGGQIWLFEP